MELEQVIQSMSIIKNKGNQRVKSDLALLANIHAALGFNNIKGQERYIGSGCSGCIQRAIARIEAWIEMKKEEENGVKS